MASTEQTKAKRTIEAMGLELLIPAPRPVH
jgi:hypothetical protein